MKTLDYSGVKIPVTIDELKEYCRNNKIDPYETNFYVDIDHIGPDAYGIFKDYWTDDYLVYENLNDGLRTVHYQGKDEAEAVKVFFDSLMTHIGGMDIVKDHKPSNMESSLLSNNEEENHSLNFEYETEPDNSPETDQSAGEIHYTSNAFKSAEEVYDAIKTDESAEDIYNTCKSDDQNQSLQHHSGISSEEKKADDAEVEILKANVSYQKEKGDPDTKALKFAIALIAIVIKFLLMVNKESQNINNNVSNYDYSVDPQIIERIAEDYNNNNPSSSLFDDTSLHIKTQEDIDKETDIMQQIINEKLLEDVNVNQSNSQSDSE